MKSFVQLAVLLLVAFNLQPNLRADELPDIGDVAAHWVDLIGTDDKRHSLDDLAEFDVVVVAFTCNSCPYSVDYEDRLIELKTKYSMPGSKVQLIAINSNTIAADNIDAMKERAAAKKFNFPYLWDESQQVAKDFGAIYTPEFFVLNQQRKIVYKGALDDSTKAMAVKLKYVELAIEAVLTGKSPAVSKTGARGCAIRFKRNRR